MGRGKGGDLPDLLQYYMGGQPNLLQYYMGGGSAETPKLYYVIYEQPLIFIWVQACRRKQRQANEVSTILSLGTTHNK